MDNLHYHPSGETKSQSTLYVDMRLREIEHASHAERPLLYHMARGLQLQAGVADKPNAMIDATVLASCAYHQEVDTVFHNHARKYGRQLTDGLNNVYVEGKKTLVDFGRGLLHVTPSSATQHTQEEILITPDTFPFHLATSSLFQAANLAQIAIGTPHEDEYGKLLARLEIQVPLHLAGTTNRMRNIYLTLVHSLKGRTGSIYADIVSAAMRDKSTTGIQHHTSERFFQSIVDTIQNNMK